MCNRNCEGTTNLRKGEGQSDESGGAGGGAYTVVEPVDGSTEVESDSAQEVVKVGFGQAEVAGAAQLMGTDRLGKGAFNAGAVFIALLESGRGLEGAPGL